MQENVINITEFALAFKWFILPIKKSRHVSLFEMYVYMPTKCNGLSSCGLTVGRVLWRPKAQRLKQRINPQLARSSGGRATRQFGYRSVQRRLAKMRVVQIRLTVRRQQQAAPLCMEFVPNLAA